MMKRLILPAVILSAFLGATVAAWSQTQSTINPNRTIYFSTSLENDASRTVELPTFNIPILGGSEFHTHPGDQWTAVQEGEVTLTFNVEPPRTRKAGGSAYIPRGTVHRNQNLTDKPARTIELNIVDKGKPELQLVKELGMVE
jgi:quercetin dioxygenase-like cupin family protein